MFPSLEAMYASFEKFVDLLPEDGTLIVCAEDSGAAALIPHVRQKGINIVAYYIQNEMTISSAYWVMARNVKANQRGGFDFVVSSNLGTTGLTSVDVSLQVPGKHNVRNALAVFAIADLLGLPREQVASALGKFTGTGRRFQLKGEANGISIFDDYAHHPTEIKATLEGARARFPNRKIWAVWQPHTYSRTQTLFLEFSRAFKDADEVIVTEVYAAREPKQEFTSAEIISQPWQR
jgi:UDP-N-acetylmuramate--alanine ligase